MEPNLVSRMKIFWWISILCIGMSHVIVYAHVEKFKSSPGSMVCKSIYNLKPRSVAIFMNNAMISNKMQDFFFRNLASHIPTIMIDITAMKNIGDNRTLEMPNFVNPRLSTLYVILQNADSIKLQEIYNIFHYFVKISPVAMRPKCLLILYNETENVPNYVLKNILSYAWSLKFLDFSIINLNSSDKILFLNYNPFNKSFKEKSSENLTVIFPDKLINANNYRLKLPMFNSPPFLLVNITHNKKININGSYYPYLETFAKKLNFDFDFVFDVDCNFTRLINRNIDKLINNEWNMLPGPFRIINGMQYKDFLMGKAVHDTKMVVVIPIRPLSKVNFPFSVLIYVLFFPLFVFSFAVLIYLFGFQSSQWNILYIFKVLLGMTVSKPEKSVERIIFFTIVILSVIYCATLVAKITDIKLLDEYEIHTFDDLHETKMTIFTRDSARDYDDIQMKKLFSKSKKIENDVDCIKKLSKTRNVICIIPSSRATFFVKNNLDDSGTPLMKIAKLSFRQGYSSFFYEKASPFAGKIDKIIQFIVESGIPCVWRDYMLKRRVTNNLQLRMASAITSDVLVLQLTIIIVIGLSVSMAAFIYELSRNREHMYI